MSETANRYTLKYPITSTFKGPQGDREETITEVTLRRVVAGDLRAIDKAQGDMNKALTLLARLSGLDAPTIDKMDGEDLTAVSEVIESFMPAGLPTGTT